MKMKLLLCAAFWVMTVLVNAQTNTFPASGNVGIGTTNPINLLHLTSPSPYIRFEKSGINFESGLAFTTANTYDFFLFTDNDGGNSLKIEAAGLAGEDDQFPRMQFPRTNKNIYMAQSGGNVGIGTNIPRQALHVRGRIFLEGTEGSTVMENYFHWRGHNLIFGTEAGTYAHNIVAIKPGGASEGSLFSVFEMYNAQGIGQNTLKIQLNSDGNSFFNGGNVGIGTTNPQNKLDVNGTIRAKEVKVETGWADFVFTPTYKLRPLSEVEQFIKTNGHLPEIPKADEVQQDGVNLGEMQTKLLQKVEELTLYVIELKKENVEQSKENAELKQKLANYEKQMNELKDLK
jgi:hypothetical protein